MRKTNLSENCLGSLFLRMEIGVRKECKFEWRPVQEIVFQLTDTKPTLANQGPDSKFVLGAIIKALISKLSRCSLLKNHNRLHPIPNSHADSSLPDYLIFHTCIHNYLSVCKMKLGKREGWIVKGDYGCVNSNTQIPDHYLTWYSTLIKARLLSCF